MWPSPNPPASFSVVPSLSAANSWLLEPPTLSLLCCTTLPLYILFSLSTMPSGINGENSLLCNNSIVCLGSKQRELLGEPSRFCVNMEGSAGWWGKGFLSLWGGNRLILAFLGTVFSSASVTRERLYVPKPPWNWPPASWAVFWSASPSFLNLSRTFCQFWVRCCWPLPVVSHLTQPSRPLELWVCSSWLFRRGKEWVNSCWYQRDQSLCLSVQKCLLPRGMYVYNTVRRIACMFEEVYIYIRICIPISLCRRSVFPVYKVSIRVECHALVYTYETEDTCAQLWFSVNGSGSVCIQACRSVCLLKGREILIGCLAYK